MTIANFVSWLTARLETLYDAAEARSVATIFVCDELNLSRTQMYLQNDNDLDKCTADKLMLKSERLQNGEPVQYVTGVASFCGLNFKVDPNVLIPRQETEMLVEAVCEHAKSLKQVNILDVGCGSGCISVCIKKFLPNASVFSIDISDGALDIAGSNAKLNDTEVSFAKYDILSESGFPFSEKFDIVVSNPPYVCNKEKALMHRNVLEYEPALALFVEDSDPLLFYRSILKFIKRHQPNYTTSVFFEINEMFGQEMQKLCNSYGCNTDVLKDLNGKDRFVKLYF